MPTTIRWGILSTANIARAAVIPAIQAAANNEVIAVASRDAGRAADFAGKLGIPRAYGSYEALLDDDAIDAVYIALPNSLHFAWTVNAAAAGKHILCEKPLALDAAQCIEMGDAAEEGGVLLMEAFMYRFHPQITAALDLVHEGAIGELHHMHAAFTFRVTDPANIRLQADLGGGSLMDVGCYCINALRTFAGREPVEVQATAAWHANGVDERMAGLLSFDDGLTGQFDAALDLARRETFLAAGTEATLDLPRAYLPGAGDTTVRIRKSYADVSEQTIAGCDEYQLMVEHFADCVRTGQPPRYGPAEAACNMTVIEALYRSARAGGRPVPVPTY
ncbi:MAG: Gfo/Idh/MocA family oxidoreductase [Caldilinea sp.]|nr:Gfo/Idh/MocA family oxidoreductase [Caldilineaceae bacterium]MCB9124933.1 Gfo/Idh/MocA family oxidoreductase [Caldilineaceae bacterium]MCW5843103.1 Gfo/Idh/MocA family oxidoreductase [Caldilinea sp.]